MLRYWYKVEMYGGRDVATLKSIDTMFNLILNDGGSM